MRSQIDPLARRKENVVDPVKKVEDKKSIIAKRGLRRKTRTRAKKS
jgi:hypothetical protein